MTDTASPTPPAADSSVLLASLAEVGRDPVEHAEEIRQLREAELAARFEDGDSERDWIDRDLSRTELRFLVRQASLPGRSAEVRQRVQAAEKEFLALEHRSLVLRDLGDPAALFDLVELRAAYLAKDGVEQADELLELRVQFLAAIDVESDELLQEARERYAALLTEEEELSLREKAHLLEETRDLMRGIHERGGAKEFKRMGRRLARAAVDRRLSLRLEHVLTPRGARFLELLSLTLLFGLFGLLIVQSIVPLSDGWTRAFRWVDAGICLFFIAEFLFKLALAPSRSSFFLRFSLTDFLPAIPAALFLFQVPVTAQGGEAIAVRALRFLRIAYFARYVQMLRPLLRVFRLVLFLIRGLDYMVRRFSPLLNRNFVFFEAESGAIATPGPEEDPRQLGFRALRREHVLLRELPSDQRTSVLGLRADRLAEHLAQVPGVAARRAMPLTGTATARDVPVEDAIEQLHALRPEEIGLWMPRQDMLALDRVGRILNAPLVRSLPFVRQLRSPEPLPSPEERVVDLGKRVANYLERWRERMLFFADLQGILTGPQVLDRIATALVNASKRPATRLLLFGGLFLLVRLIVGSDSGIGEFLKKFVATPLLVLGGVCWFLLLLGRWLKRIAGEAAETLRRTSEAHFIGLLDVVKARHEEQDVGFLARRVFRWELDQDAAGTAILRQVTVLRRGIAHTMAPEPPPEVYAELNRTALLYLHFRSGAILHGSDVKTSEQLLANLSLENIRRLHLCYSSRDRKRLRKLSLDEGALLSGPYLWFRCITESVSLETAKRVIDYNRHCVPRARIDVAPTAEREAMEQWVRKRRAEVSGRMLERLDPPDAGDAYSTTEFNALDFLSATPDREEHIRRMFGEEIVELMRMDRRRMVREIFGSRPLHELPRNQRTVNFYRLYESRLSNGRVFLLPIYWLLFALRGVRLGMRKTVEIVREVLSPQSALTKVRSNDATFEVVLRKIHRMKAPGLLELIGMRAAFDPAYCGAPTSWTGEHRTEQRSELERDMDFLDMKERQREEFRAIAVRMRDLVEDGHRRLSSHAAAMGTMSAARSSVLDRRLGERAVTVAYVTDLYSMRTLLRARDWFEQTLARFESKETRLRRSTLVAFGHWVLRGFRRHPVSRWAKRCVGARRLSRRALRNYKAAYQARDLDVRETVDAWLALGNEAAPQTRALELLTRVFENHEEISRELCALRAVQSLSVLDVRNYRGLIYQLGDYAADGVESERADGLP